MRIRSLGEKYKLFFLTLSTAYTVICFQKPKGYSYQSYVCNRFDECVKDCFQLKLGVKLLFNLFMLL